MNEQVIPDRWVILEATFTPGTVKMILSGWIGGYLSGESWRMSSPIKNIQEFDDRYELDTETGSEYICYKKRYGLTGYTSSILSTYQKQQPELSLTILKEYEV